MVCRYVNWSVAPPPNDDAPALLVNGGANVAADAVTSTRWEVLLEASTAANMVVELLGFFDATDDFSCCSSLLVICAAALPRQLKVFPWGLFPRPNPIMFVMGNRIATVVHTTLHIIVNIHRSGHRDMIK